MPHVNGLAEPLVASRSVRAILADVEAALARSPGGRATASAVATRREPPLTRFVYWIASQECTLIDAKARRELGYEPVVSHEQGLAELRSR